MIEKVRVLDQEIDTIGIEDHYCTGFESFDQERKELSYQFISTQPWPDHPTGDCLLPCKYCIQPFLEQLLLLLLD